MVQGNFDNDLGPEHQQIARVQFGVLGVTW
jgi:hypothetical protein